MFSTKEDYSSNLVRRTGPLLFNLRGDPFESYSDNDPYGHHIQKVSWLMQPMGEMMAQHLETPSGRVAR